MDSFNSEQWKEFARYFDAWEAATPAERARIVASIVDPEVKEMFLRLNAWPRQRVDAMEGVRLRDNLVITRRIGMGGMGAVYEAERRIGSSVSIVAVKVVRPDWLGISEAFTGFRREMDQLLGLQHRGIIQLIDAGAVTLVEGGPAVPWFAMERLVGDVPLVMMPGVPVANRQLYDRLLRTVQDKLVVFEQLLEAMAYAHRYNVLHLDLSPNNVRVVPGPEVQVIDFGLSAMVDVLRPSTLHLLNNGTPGYQAPEVLVPTLGRIGKCSDVHALGVLGYQLFLGEVPYAIHSAPMPASTSVGAGRLDRAMIDAAIASPARRKFADLLRTRIEVRDTLMRYADVMDMACAQNPGERFASAGDFLAAWKAAGRNGGREGGRGVVDGGGGGGWSRTSKSGMSAGNIHGGNNSVIQIVGPGGRASHQSNNRNSFNQGSFNRKLSASHGGIVVGGKVVNSTLSASGTPRSYRPRSR